MRYLLLIIISIVLPVYSFADLLVGVDRSDITPPVGTPSAGYEKRLGAGMQGVRDPLYAVSMVVDTGNKKIIFCSVDNLGLPYKLIQRIKNQVINSAPNLADAAFIIGSTHTHSGGGAFMDIPGIGELLAGPYNETIATMYVDRIAQSILQAAAKQEPASMGIGYTKVEGLSLYRAKWPEHYTLENDLAVIKVTKKDGSPLAVVVNFALHPTVLGADNMLFSSDFVGCVRGELNALLGTDVPCLYFNGAQAEIIPDPASPSIRSTLANAVVNLWSKIDVSDQIDIRTKSHSYSFTPKTTPYGLQVPLETYPTELGLVVINQKHLFVLVPGELSCIYNTLLKNEAAKLGFSDLSIFGLVNDAHGYILLPEAMHAKTNESALSFGGEFYGKDVYAKIVELLDSTKE